MAANKGIDTFQEKRTVIVIELIIKACKYLISKNEIITAPKIEEKIRKIAKKNLIEDKYIVDSQTINRNLKYKTVLNKFKKQQNTNYSKNINNKEYTQFKLRDKFDMLSQDYLELLDEKKFLEELYSKKENDIERLKKLLRKKNIDPYENKIDSEKSIEIIQIINKLLENGPIILKKDSEKVIVKSYKQNEDERYEFLEKEWKTL